MDQSVKLASTSTKPSTLRSRLQHLPPPDTTGLWQNQAQALINVEESLQNDRPRALIQMATGSGKTGLLVCGIPEDR